MLLTVGNTACVWTDETRVFRENFCRPCDGLKPSKPKTAAEKYVDYPTRNTRRPIYRFFFGFVYNIYIEIFPLSCESKEEVRMPAKRVKMNWGMGFESVTWKLVPGFPRITVHVPRHCHVVKCSLTIISVI